MMLSGFKKYRLVALLLASSLLTLVQCKRSEEPFNNIGPTVFALKGSINGVPYSKTAGKDSFYMYTSYGYDTSNQLYMFTGKLAKIGCSTCNESIQITFYDSILNNGQSPIDLTKTLITGNYSYHSNVKAYLSKLTFVAEDSGYLSPQYLWSFGNGSFASTKTAAATFSDTAKINVCLTITDSAGNGCQSTRCNVINPPLGNKADSIIPNFSFKILGDTVIFTNLSIAPGSSNYLWDFGDTTTSTSFNIEHPYAYKSRFNVCLTVTNNGVPRTLCKSVFVGTTGFDCQANFSYNNPIVDSALVTNYKSKVVVSYIDEKGERYSSEIGGQPIGSFFTVFSSNPYDNNEDGQKTRALSVSFMCRVYSTTSAAFKDIVINESTIAVAYP